MNLSRSVARWLGHRHTLRFAIKHRILTTLHDPNKASGELFTTQFFGLTYQGKFNSYIDWCIYYMGAYARHELLFLKTVAQKLSPSSVFLDVGANVGNHSLFASSVFGQVYSFEPLPWLVDKLNQQRQRNAINNLHVFPYALGELDARQAFYSSTMANEGIGTLIKGREANTTNIVEVEVRQGDNFLTQAGIERIDVIKIDVEGFERYVLNGLSETIQRQQPIIFFEWSEEATNPNVPLTQQPYFAGYIFHRFDYGRTVGLVFERDRFRLTPISALVPHHNYVAVPTDKLALLVSYIEK
ncbi:FkbM family methyltransferase [Fibrella forsythiae]|uniref:FkbM family methyltransferase n=1 Tax=Fibrella forsythiae TaxID=2817061 RepID=A0ABS3JQN0_9BACT|nr:FkbM family methyltransferase [Fibrella forsythiae]MBO0952320.1 FkbM family methyltransferase [Fibrella forsythiae]